MTADSPVTVGVLATHTSKETKAILNAIEALGHDTEWLRRENIAVEIADGTVTVEPAVDVVVNRILVSASTHPTDAIGLASVFANIGPMLNEPGAVTTAIHKYATAVKLASAGVPVPDALLALSSDRLNAGRPEFGEQAVYKTAIGTHGGGSWVVDLDTPVNPLVGDRHAFLQRYVERPDGRQQDVRVYVVGGTVVGAMTRQAAPEEWRTNVALGGEVSDATDDLPAAALDHAITAAETIGLDYAGVDLIQDGEDWYVLEVNPTAGFRGLFRACGHSPAPHIAQLAIERVGGAVDDDTVASLATSLDDTRPSAMPASDPLEPTEATIIGYIEEVRISGTRGSQTVLAKADTGADRSSIDAELAARIGTGPIQDIVRVRSGTQKGGTTRPIVDIVVGVGGSQHTVAASVEDRSHMNYQLLLGRDILEHYHVDVTRRSGREAEE